MDYRIIKWHEPKWALPVSARNYALSSNGARATASSCEKGFEAGGAINGNTSLSAWGAGNGWKSAPFSWHPNWWGDWLQVDFAQKQEIDTIVVYSFPQMAAGRPWAALKHYQVQCMAGHGDWVTVKTVRDNTEDVNIVSFGAIETQSIRIWVNRNHFREESGYEGGAGDEAPRILEVESYLLGGKSIIQTVEHEKSVEIGEKGSIAFFYDPAFHSSAFINAEKLTVWLRKWGYGVTLLTADELCAKELFNRDCFDVFIHPYGKYIPVGTNLYGFLQGGGHMITFGGRAFTTAKQKILGEWTDIELDPALTVSKARYVDYFRPYREQLGMFTVPGSILENVHSVETNRKQSITGAAVSRIENAGGWMALGMVGELLPIDETRQYAYEGRLPAINHMAREGINRAKADTPLLWGEAMDETYGSIFSYPCARWISLIDSFDRSGRNRGPVAAMMLHYEGMYRGSHWAYFGVENSDVLTWEHMDEAIGDILRFLRLGVVAHSLEPSYSFYRQNESVDFSVIVDNTSPSHREIRLDFRIADSCGKVAYTNTQAICLQPKSWRRLDFTWEPGQFQDDFYRLTADVYTDGSPIDRLENGFTIWNEEILSNGPDVEFKENYFRVGGKPSYIIGARDSGIHMPWQPEENSIRWEEQYKMLRDFGMRIISPVHFDWCIPGLGWGEFDEENPVPEIMLRRMDAQVQIAQKNQLIYAPCIFFAYEKIAMQKPGIAKRICEFLGERYKKARGIIFYLFDDGLRHDPDRFNDWAGACVEGLNACGRNYMVTAEIGFRQIWPDTMRRSAKHLTFSSGSVFQQSVGDPVYERLIDLRPAGKSFTMGEFVRRIPMGTAEDFHGYLAPPHVNLGMGYAMGMNWKWATTYHTIWPSDVLFPGNNIPKKHLYAFRNEALFFSLFQPYYKSPDLLIVMPSEFWVLNSEALTRYLVDLLRRLIEMRVDFACIDSGDIALLPQGAKALILPLPLEISDDCYNRVKEFAERGGSVFVIGDLGKQGAEPEAESCPQWLEELCGVEKKGAAYGGLSKGRSLFMSQFMRRQIVESAQGEYSVVPWLEIEPGRAGTVLAAKDGSPIVTCAATRRGQVWFMNDLGTAFSPQVFQDFFLRSGIGSISLDPDLPTLHCFKVHAHSGPVYTMFTFPWDAGKIEAKLDTEAGKVSMFLKDQTMGVVSLTSDEKGIWALETQGRVALDSRVILETNTHVMLAALDRKDIRDSAALLLLPVFVGRAAVKSRALDTVESGEIIAGQWKTYSVAQANHMEGEDLVVEIGDASVLYLAYHADDRERAVELLESSFR